MMKDYELNEEEETISCTSSAASLSPTTPLFHGRVGMKSTAPDSGPTMEVSNTPINMNTEEEAQLYRNPSNSTDPVADEKKTPENETRTNFHDTVPLGGDSTCFQTQIHGLNHFGSNNPWGSDPQAFGSDAGHGPFVRQGYFSDLINPQAGQNKTQEDFQEIDNFEAHSSYDQMYEFSDDDKYNDGGDASLDHHERNPLLHHHRLPSTIVEEAEQWNNSVNVERDGGDSARFPDEGKIGTDFNSGPRLVRKVASMSTLLPNMSSPPGDAVLQASSTSGTLSGFLRKSHEAKDCDFQSLYTTTKIHAWISRLLLREHYTPLAAATWIGFWAHLHVTCANYVIMPLRDAMALQVGVEHVPKLTLASTVLAFCSSVPIGWLFEAPDPNRRKLFKRMGLTRGETQGTSLALFFRSFAFCIVSYAVGFQLIEILRAHPVLLTAGTPAALGRLQRWANAWFPNLNLWAALGQTLYVAFFLVVHVMKLHSLSLLWGVTTEAMEYEEVARKKRHIESNKTRLEHFGLIGFGGTIGGILGSFLASSMAHTLRLPGLLVLAAVLLEVSAELSIELGRIMQKHWEEQQLFQSSNDLSSLDSSMQRSASLGSMKRVSSGNSLNRVRSSSELHKPSSLGSVQADPSSDDTFSQRLLRGARTILRSRLLMAIFSYNALYASTTVLLSFQRAELVANRKNSTTVQADTAFLANINMVSSVAVFALQASSVGANIATMCGQRGTLAVMPLIRLAGVLSLAWWHRVSNGRPPNLVVFLIIDEFTKIVNLAVAKPVRESLWCGLSNEARYEAKPIVDTLANRWGAGSAAFLASFITKTLDLFLVAPTDPNETRTLFGFPPILFLTTIISAWWAVVSADLGQIRRNIDIELKKRQ